jgi:hypothetical protein
MAMRGALRLLLALAILPAGVGTAAAAALPPPPPAAQRTTYLVDFDEPPLASFRGGDRHGAARVAGLAATSPAATGARRLDVASRPSRAYRAALAALRQERLARAAATLGRALEPSRVYEIVKNGVALELTAEEARMLATLDGVRRVSAERTLELHSDAGPAWVGAETVWNSGVAASRGEGALLGVLDTGINRSHPSFAGLAPDDGYVHVNPKAQFLGLCAPPVPAAACNGKLIGIYDFTTGAGTRETDDGRDVSGHGTHVASTALGNRLTVGVALPGGGSSIRSISGVAPRANLIAYKVCEAVAINPQDGPCKTSWVVAALEQAVADGVDVVNASLGDTPRDPWSDDFALAALAAREAGVVFVASAGNGGNGTVNVGSPSDAPWSLSVAAATHARGLRNRVVDLGGGDSAPPSGGVLSGQGAGSVGPRALVYDPQHPLCSQGADFDAGQTGVSNPWPAGRFNGEIVVCLRGEHARVAKSNNVRLAGGAGMVLINAPEDGEDVVLESHRVPTVHLGYADGQALMGWLLGGQGHSARIEGAQLYDDPALGDVLGGFSSGGPAFTPGVMKPDLAAPGVDIIAASGSGSGLSQRSGTSMSAPAVAGAALLLAARRPAWSPSTIVSALVTTARPSVRMPDGSAAGPFHQGGGMLDVSRAVAAGLALEITGAQFGSASPAAGGVPRELDLPSVAHERCAGRCEVTRRFTDLLGGGSWRVEFELPAGVQAGATPATFTLGAAQAQTVAFEFDVASAPAVGAWMHGRIRLIRTGGGSPDIVLPLSLFVTDALFLDGFEGIAP